MLNLSLYVFPLYGPAVIVRSTRTTLRGTVLLVSDSNLFAAALEEEASEEEEEGDEEEDDADTDEVAAGSIETANFARTSFSFAASNSSNSARVYYLGRDRVHCDLSRKCFSRSSTHW